MTRFTKPSMLVKMRLGIKFCLCLTIFILTNRLSSAQPINSGKSYQTMDFHLGPFSLKLPANWHIPQGAEKNKVVEFLKSDILKPQPIHSVANKSMNHMIAVLDCNIIFLPDKAGDIVIWSVKREPFPDYYAYLDDESKQKQKALKSSGAVVKTTKHEFLNIDDHKVHFISCIQNNGCQSTGITYWNPKQNSDTSAIVISLRRPNSKLANEIEQVIKDIKIH